MWKLGIRLAFVAKRKQECFDLICIKFKAWKPTRQLDIKCRKLWVIWLIEIYTMKRTWTSCPHSEFNAECNFCSHILKTAKNAIKWGQIRIGSVWGAEISEQFHFIYNHWNHISVLQWLDIRPHFRDPSFDVKDLLLFGTSYKSNLESQILIHFNISITTALQD